MNFVIVKPNSQKNDFILIVYQLLTFTRPFDSIIIIAKKARPQFPKFRFFVKVRDIIGIKVHAIINRRVY